MSLDAAAKKTWADIKFFKPSEFASPDAPDSGYRMDMDLIVMLDELRRRCGFPLKINSGWRTPDHNIKVGGKPSSEHLLGRGVDIAANNSHTRFVIKREAFAMGFKRIGHGKTFIHLGIDPTLPQEVEWEY